MDRNLPDAAPSGTEFQGIRPSRDWRRSLVRRGRQLADAAYLLAVVWTALALWYFPLWPRWLNILAAAVCVIFAIAVRWKVAPPWRWVAAAGLVLAVVALMRQNQPSNDRPWTADQARMPLATFVEQSDEVVIEQMRRATYRTTDDYDVEWFTGRYRLDEIESVDYAVEPFSTLGGLAHTFLTFGFANGDHVAISIEIRKEQGEVYSPLAGMFRHYELSYVVGDERDLIGLRTNVRGNPVRLYPIKATQQEVRDLFVDMLRRGNRLRTEPEFYHSLTNNCTTNIVHHLEDLTGWRIPFRLGILLPGFSDRLAYAWGLIDTELSFTEARQRFLLDGQTEWHDDPRLWSRQIRAKRAAGS